MRILIILLISLQSFADEQVIRLEDSYVKKANILKADYEKKSLSLAKSYVRALKEMKYQRTQRGDIQDAKNIEAKIKEITKMYWSM